MISEQLTRRAVSLTMNLLCGCGPCDPGWIRDELLAGVIGINASNIDEVYDAAKERMTRGESPMIEVETDPAFPGHIAYRAAARMYDANGHYNGAE